jgi:DnaJ family protein A protein 2
MFSEFSGIIQGNASFSQIKMNPFGNFKFCSTNENTMSSPVNMEVFPASPSHNQEFVRGQDIHHTCNMTLGDLYYGKTLKLQLPRFRKCGICNGIGGHNPRSCRTCEGNGSVVVNHYNEFLKFQQVGTCESCKGSGIFVAPQDKCLDCNGCGYTKERKLLKVVVFPGTKDDDKIILHGEGDEGRNVIPGDVIIHIKEIPHSYLIRKYHDLYMEYDIDLKTALLGGEIYIDNFLREKQSLKLHINVHGNPALNSEAVQLGEILGTINPGEPKIVKGFGMPINEAVQGGEYIQNLDEVDDLLDVCYDLKRYQKGNLFINFKVKLPSLNEMSEQGLFQLQSILPDTITVPPTNHNILDGYLANITSSNKESRDSSNAPVMDSESDTETFNYNDIDINDSVEVEEEDEQFYDKEWDAELRKRRRL